MSKEAVLSRIRRSLGVPRHGDALRIKATDARMAVPERHPTPGRVALSKDDLIKLFAANMRVQSADVLEAAGLDAVPALMASHLEGLGLSGNVRTGGDPLLVKLSWDRAPKLQRVTGRAGPSDTLGLSVALAAIAETGTLLLASGADNPTTLAFLPETHLVIVREETIVGAFEDAFDILRARFGRHVMPRSLNLISAPSRTGDIGGKIVLGAHGPRRLVVIILKNEKPET